MTDPRYLPSSLDGRLSHVVCENVNEAYGEEILLLLQGSPRRPDDHWYRLAPDDYAPYVFDPT